MTEEIREHESSQAAALPQPSRKKQGSKNMLRDILGVIISAVLISFALKMFVLDSRIVPTSSMVPTIDAGDRIIMLRFPYFFGGRPQTQDVVVFAPNEEFESNDDLLKRVIGLPGDVVEVKENKVFVNGAALSEPYLNESPQYEYGPVTVPEGCYFMLGDNRNRSRDSHMWDDPFVPFSSVKGKVVLCYWPTNHIGKVE